MPVCWQQILPLESFSSSSGLSSSSSSDFLASSSSDLSLSSNLLMAFRLTDDFLQHFPVSPPFAPPRDHKFATSLFSPPRPGPPKVELELELELELKLVPLPLAFAPTDSGSTG